MNTEAPIDEVGEAFRRSYQWVIDQAPLPVEAPPTGPFERGQVTRPKPAMAAGAVAAAVVLVATLGVALLRPGGPLFGPLEVEYLRLSWSQEVELRCIGMEAIDNGGFDDAVIEIWGPSPDDMWRLEVMFPDGSGFVNISEGKDLFMPSRVWSDVEPFPSPFRETSCSVMIDDEGFEWALSDSPLIVGSFQENQFFAISPALADQLSASPEAGQWRGIDIAIYRTEASGEDENGRYASLGSCGWIWRLSDWKGGSARWSGRPSVDRPKWSKSSSA